MRRKNYKNQTTASVIGILFVIAGSIAFIEVTAPLLITTAIIVIIIKIVKKIKAKKTYNEKEKIYYEDLNEEEPLDQIEHATEKEKYIKQAEYQTNQKQYTKKEEYQTNCEKYYYKILKEEFGEQYDIFPQVPLSSVVAKEKQFKKQYQNELFRIIDFGIFEKETQKPLLLIEINDKTHKQQKRIERDNKVKEICNNANIELITFWTDEKQSKEDIIYKIKNKLDYII